MKVVYTEPPKGSITYYWQLSGIKVSNLGKRPFFMLIMLDKLLRTIIVFIF